MNEFIDSSRRDLLLQPAVLCAGTVLGGTGMLLAQTAGGPGNGPYPTDGMAGHSETGPLQPLKFQRRALGAKDVAIRIDYCGVCHSDIHTIHGDRGKVAYPLVVGHEAAGEVVAIGAAVSKFVVGARVGVGTMVNSCRECPECARGAENYCEKGSTQSYGSKDRDGTITQGGYSRFVVVDQDFVLHIPASIDLAEAGPLLCAGITTYSPLRHWGVGAGKRVAIAGLGGLGHLAVQFASRLGAEVTVVTTSPDKEADARRFGAERGSDQQRRGRFFEVQPGF